MKIIRLALAAMVAVISAALPSRGQSLQNMTKTADNVIRSEYETDSEGNRKMNYYNSDYCDYLLFRVNDKSYNLSPGKNTVFTQRKGSNAVNPFHNPGYYRIYKGIFPENFNAGFAYALPVADRKSVSWTTDRRERMKTMNFDIPAGDTVCAARYGTACLANDPRLLLVYHEDKTFAAYMMMQECFIAPGETVYPGMAVGLAGNAGVSISFFFLDRNKFSGETPVSYPYTHFIPHFSTASGVIRPKEDIILTAETTDETVTSEMTKREKKKYLKNRKPRQAATVQEEPAEKALAGIRWMNDPVDGYVKEKAEKRISAETAYLERTGLKPDLDFTLYCFKNRDSAGVFLEERFGRSINPSAYRTFYMGKERTGVLIGYDEKDTERNVEYITDLVSRHAVRSAAETTPAPTWFSTGIVRYFVSWHTDRKGPSFHVLDARDKVKVKSAALIGELDIRSFLDISHNDYYEMQATDNGLAYALSHVIITNIIDRGYDDVTREMLSRDRGDKPSEIIERTYPGGIEALEKDVLKTVGIEAE